MRSVLFEDRPCNYGLAWQTNPSAIIIRIQRQIAIRAALVKPTPKLMEEEKKRLKTDSFCSQIAGPFGFDQILYPRVGNDSFIELEARLPKKAEVQGRAEHQLNVGRLTATLRILFAHLNAQKVDVPEVGNHKQLLTMSLSSVKSSDKHVAISATYSPHFYDWLNSFEPQHSFKGVSDCMRTTYSLLTNYADTDKLDFIAQIIRPYGYLQLSCPNCDEERNCGIYPSDYDGCRKSVSRNRGCKVISYNLSNNVQQLTLLAGLARLHDIARQRIN